MARSESKPIRRISEHFRGRGKAKVAVSSYHQRYDAPRGMWSKDFSHDAYTPRSKTAWIKDSKGRFIGRTNARGQTSARKSAIAYGAYDKTKTFRERGKYGRIRGRVESS